MIELRKSEERGYADHGWLKSRHTFSFADYYDPAQMGFRSLRVINEDRIAGGTGFNMHGHRDMEIISYVVTGALRHKDSQGNEAIIKPGEVQKMSAGTGVMHSEFNNLPNEETHFFQIWIVPNKTGVTFSYGQKSFEDELNNKDKVLVISQTGRDGSISINQDADLYISRIKAGKEVSYDLQPSRHAWIQAVKGSIQINGQKLDAGDAAKISDLQNLKILASEDSEILFFDLP